MSLAYRKPSHQSRETRRWNVRLSTSLHTQTGKPRVALNSLRHGSFMCLPWRSVPVVHEDDCSPINTAIEKQSWYVVIYQQLTVFHKRAKLVCY